MTTTAILPQVLIQIPTEISYWGDSVTRDEVPFICDNMESILESQFGHRFHLSFHRTPTPYRECVQSDDEDAVLEMRQWILDNWYKALVLYV